MGITGTTRGQMLTHECWLVGLVSSGRVNTNTVLAWGELLSRRHDIIPTRQMPKAAEQHHLNASLAGPKHQSDAVLFHTPDGSIILFGD